MSKETRRDSTGSLTAHVPSTARRPQVLPTARFDADAWAAFDAPAAGAGAAAAAAGRTDVPGGGCALEIEDPQRAKGAVVEGLEPGTEYVARIVLTNPAGTTPGVTTEAICTVGTWR